MFLVLCRNGREQDGLRERRAGGGERVRQAPATPGQELQQQVSQAEQEGQREEEGEGTVGERGFLPGWQQCRQQVGGRVWDIYIYILGIIFI